MHVRTIQLPSLSRDVKWVGPTHLDVPRGGPTIQVYDEYRHKSPNSVHAHQARSKPMGNPFSFFSILFIYFYNLLLFKINNGLIY